MPYEYTPPKYAQVIDELRRRIESGEYPPGSLLPSEHQLSDEFQIARPTVVRALRVLRQDGWIETQQGKGSFVRGRPALAGLESQRTGEEALNRDESREPGELIEAGISAPAPPGWPRCSAGRTRRRCWPGGWLSARTARPRSWSPGGCPRRWPKAPTWAWPSRLHGGVRGHLSRRKGIRVDHVLEQVTARHPTTQEARLLGVGKSAPMLAMYVAARDASGEPVLVLEVVMPGDRHELEDAYQVG